MLPQTSKYKHKQQTISNKRKQSTTDNKQTQTTIAMSDKHINSNGRGSKTMINTGQTIMVTNNKQ